MHSIFVLSRVALAASFVVLAACGKGSSPAASSDDSIPYSVPLIPHTGIKASQCYKAGSDDLVSCAEPMAKALSGTDKQDGMYTQIKPMSYTRLDSIGAPSLDTATTWCAVKDNVTGLIWENHQGAPALYTNYGDSRDGDTSKYAADKRNQNPNGLCGFSNWRVPTVDELESIVDASKVAANSNTPTIHEFFPLTTNDGTSNGVNQWYWTQTLGASSTSNERSSVSFAIASTANSDTTSNGSIPVRFPVRLVRAPDDAPSDKCPSWPTSERFTFHGGGTAVKDKRTGMVWARCSVGQSWNGTTCTGTPTTFTHEEALKYAKDQAGWRLPNRRELFSLADKGCRTGAAIDSAAFPATLSAKYWTSSPAINSDKNTAWHVRFTGGTLTSATPRTEPMPIRLVRVVSP